MVQINAGSWFVVERFGFSIVIPFAGGIEFFKDVFHHSERLVHSRFTVVLPAAYVGHFALRVLSGDPVVIAPPACAMDRMNIATGWVFPICRTRFRKCISSKALVWRRFFGSVVQELYRARNCDESLRALLLQCTEVHRIAEQA